MSPPEPLRPATGGTRPFTLVTGGSAGIGLAIARRFAARGHALLLVARDRDRLEAAAAALRREYGSEVATLALDLAAPEALARLDAELARLGGHVEHLVNNAGIGYCGDFAETGPADLDRLLTLNMGAPTRLMRHVLAGMRRRGTGGVLNVASLGGYVPGPYQAAYYASKAYLISLSEAVAAEVRPYGVRVTVAAPGPVSTRFHADMHAEGALYRRFLPSSSPESVARWAVLGYELGVRVVVPGIHNVVAMLALRILPHALLIPVMAMLLHPRRESDKGAAEDA